MSLPEEGATPDAEPSSALEPARDAVAAPLAGAHVPPDKDPLETPPPIGPSPSPVPWEVLRKVALALMLATAAGIFIWQVNGHYALGDWLFWRYLRYWVAAGVWAASCVAAGHSISVRLLRRTLPLREHIVLSFAIGVFAFFLLMFGCGLLHLYGKPLFFLAPLLLLAAGAPDTWRTLKRVRRHLHLRRMAPPPPWVWPLGALGLVATAMLYFAILSPENTSFDARWYHLPIAEHYVAQGAMKRFQEGWYVGTSPHLASFLYTWAFLQPASDLFDRIELAAHIEFVCFLFTLAAIPVLVRRLVRGTRARFTWVARFLFPGIFLYDSSLVTGADHVAALFAVPIFVLTMRWWQSLDLRQLALLLVTLSGAFLTKYTGAMILIAGPLLAIVARGCMLAAQALRARLRGGDARAPLGLLGRSMTLALVGGLLLTAPHWLKNWIWHGDPIYPLLHGKLALRPWTSDSAERFVWGFLEAEMWKPTRDWAGVKQTLRALFTFSFMPNDWPKFHGKVPVFGSLFTLALLALPFVRASRRVWGLFAAAHLGVFVWYWTHHQDRYLQAVVPWMTAATVAVLILAWRSGLVARVLTAVLVALQVVWGGDVYFIPGHAMIKSPWKTAGDLISSGYRKDLGSRKRVVGSFVDVGAALPPGAKVLVHDYRMHLGLGAMSVSDAPVNQGGISYGGLGSPGAIYEKLRSYGVTHLVWPSRGSSGSDSLAGDMAFFDFALRYAEDAKSYGSLTLARMPDTPPPDKREQALVGIFGCGRGTFTRGFYRLEQVNLPVRGPRRAHFPKATKKIEGRAIPEEELGDVAMLAVDPKCTDAPPTSGANAFVMAAKRKGGVEIWVRRRDGGAAPAPSPAAPPSPDPLDDFGPHGGDLE
jgi:hypothetical protein